jgi:hypothetical protein
VFAFIKIKFDIESLRSEKEMHIDLIQKFMGNVVTHDGMKEYVNKIKEEGEKISSLKENYQKEKWQNLKQAFGRKKEDEV